MCEKDGSDNKPIFLVLYFDAQMSIHEFSMRIDRPVRTLEAWVRRVKKKARKLGCVLRESNTRNRGNRKQSYSNAQRKS